MNDCSGTVCKSSFIKVAWAAHKGAGLETGKAAEALIHQLLPADSFVMTDQQPDIILFMSGGSERKAISLADPGYPVLLLSIRGNNAYAAATEVMAWMVNNSRFAFLSDATDACESGLIGRWSKTVGVWKSLEGKKAGLVGSVSDWLVASDVPVQILLQRFGILLEEIPWNSLPDYTLQEPDPTLLNRFKDSGAPGLIDASRVLNLLRKVILEKGLSAIAVECFSLVQQRKVTACLALAQLNFEGVVAACEGDLASMAGMLLLRDATGQVPWMANTTRLTGHSLILSHCTAGFDLVSNIQLPTHFETDCSLAVKGIFLAREVTLFRLSADLSKAFLAEGRIVGNTAYTNACRTQAEIELSSGSLDILKNRPLGNHLLMAPGDHAALLRLVCNYKGIKVIE